MPAADRLDEIGNLSLQQAIENSGRLSAMMGIRAAQANPIEAASISSIKGADNSGNIQAMAMSNALAAIAANLAGGTPNPATK